MILEKYFIKKEEVPTLLKKRKNNGLRIVPIVFEHCLWKQIDWLSKLQVAQKDGKPLNKYSDSEIDELLVNIIEDIAKDV